MDEQRMTPWSFESLPAWVKLFSLAIHFVAGFAAGNIYFLALWRNARVIVFGGRTMTTIALIFGRVLLLGALLTLASLEGAPPLLSTALGVFVARSVFMRRYREVAP